MANRGVIIGTVEHDGKRLERALVRIGWIRSQDNTFNYSHVKGPEWHTIDYWTNNEGCFGLPFLFEGYDVGRAIDLLTYELQVGSPQLPKLPIRMIRGKMRWKVRLDVIAGMNDKRSIIATCGIDAWQVMRSVKLPSLFTGAATISPSPEYVMIVGYNEIYL